MVRKGQVPAALALYDQARPMQEALVRVDAANSQMRMELSVTFSKMSEALVARGDLASAVRARANDLQLSERVLKDDPTSPAYRRMYSYGLFQMGDLLRKEAKKTEARRYFLRQAEVLRPLESEPDKSTQRQLLNCYRALGELEGDPRVSSAYLNKALAMAQKLGDDAALRAIRQAVAALPQ